MERTRKPKRDDEEQSKRFIEAARKTGADESGDAFERVFNKLMSKPSPAPKQKSPRK